MTRSSLTGSGGNIATGIRNALRRSAVQQLAADPNRWPGLARLIGPTPFAYQPGVLSNGALATPNALPPADIRNPLLPKAPPATNGLDGIPYDPLTIAR